MKNKELITLMEFCLNENCSETAYIIAIKESLNLINRQDTELKTLQESTKQLARIILKERANYQHLQAENNNLKIKVKALKAAINYYKRGVADIERLKNLLSEEEKKNSKFAKHFFKEGVIACAKKVKAKTLVMLYSPDELTEDDYIECINNTVKELTGE